MTCFEIISNVGTARGCYVEAIDLATEGNFEEAEKKMKAKMGNTGDIKAEITELDAPAVIPQNLLERV